MKNKSPSMRCKTPPKGIHKPVHQFITSGIKSLLIYHIKAKQYPLNVNKSIRSGHPDQRHESDRCHILFGIYPQATKAMREKEVV